MCFLSVDLDLHRLRPRDRQRWIWILSCITQGIDILYELNRIRQVGLITVSQWRELSKTSSSQVQTHRRRIPKFLNDIRQKVPPNRLFRILAHISPQQIIAVLYTPIDEDYSSKLYDCFENIKNTLDTHNGTDRSQICIDLGNEMLMDANAESNVSERQRLCDSYVITEILRIQQSRDDGYLARKRLIDDMMQRLPTGVDGRFAYLMYELKIATSEVNEGKLQEAESKISMLIGQVEMYNTSFEKAIIYHDSSYVYRCIHRATKHTKYIDKVADCACKAIAILGRSSSYTCTLARIFYLNTAMTYLGIDVKLNVDICMPIISHLLTATVLVKHVRADMRNMEARREMHLQLCQARIHEADKEIEKAMYCAHMALGLTASGGYYESDRENIETYYTRMVLKLLPPAIL